ncbi:hypothetical protein APHAL10511_007967, partial [Amanita phalloides]
MNSGAPPPSQRPEGTLPGQSRVGYFAGSEHIQIDNSTMIDVGRDYNVYEGRTGLEDLQRSIAASAIHNASRPAPRCHPGTREEPLQIINGWLNGEKPTKRLLWLYGPAGAGKSSIAQTIAESRAKDKLVASFFFFRNDKECGVPDRLFPTLAWQLAKAVPETRSYIQSAFRAEPLLATKSIDFQFDELFVKVFESLLRDRPDFRPEKSLVVIDGIDECAGEQAQKDIIGLIGDALTQHNIPLYFLLCSRPEPHIQDAFHLETMQNRECGILELVDASADIRRYLKEEFSRIFTKRAMPRPSNTEINQLVAKSSGQFIFPSTVVKFVDDEDCSARDQLDIVLGLQSSKSSSPFSSLDQLYTQILSQQPDIRLLRDVFVLVIAFGGTDIDFICRRLRIKQDDLRRKLRRMHSLIHITNYIKIYHRSLHDFFQDRRRAGRYYINPWRVKMLQLPNNVRSLRRKVAMACV